MTSNYTGSRQLLGERRRALRDEIRATLLRADSERYAAIADRIGDVEDHSLAELLAEVSHAEIARDLEEIQDIDLALRRIDSGTYGHCIQCNGPIGKARLAAYPTAKRCLPCQQVHEQHRT
jgi:RNA polymerase-binding transcription factor DksA